MLKYTSKMTLIMSNVPCTDGGERQVGVTSKPRPSGESNICSAA